MRSEQAIVTEMAQVQREIQDLNQMVQVDREAYAYKRDLLQTKLETLRWVLEGHP